MFQLRAGAVLRASHPLEAEPLIEIPSVTIAVSEQDPASTARWRIRLEAKTETGRWVLGTVLTIAPSAGGNVNRIVAIATVPGAVAWMVEARLEPGTGTPQSEAMLEMASSQCCGSLGLVAVGAELLPPVPGFLARAINLASQVLPAFPIFTAQPFTAVSLRTRSITYFVEYAKGAAGGFPGLRPEWTNGVDVSRESTLTTSFSLSPDALLGPNARPNLYLQELLGPSPDTVDPIVYAMKFIVPDGTIGVRLLASEVGLPGTPGTAQIAVTGSEG